MTGIRENDNAQIATLAEFGFAKSTDPDSCFAFTSDGIPNTRFSVDKNGVSVQVSP